jgi:hypothetical protein
VDAAGLETGADVVLEAGAGATADVAGFETEAVLAGAVVELELEQLDKNGKLVNIIIKDRLIIRNRNLLFFI